MTTLEKIGQGIVIVILFILGIPVFSLYGLYVGIRELIDTIQFYYSQR